MVELLSVCHCIRYAKSPVAGNRSFVYHEGGVFVLWIIPLSAGIPFHVSPETIHTNRRRMGGMGSFRAVVRF
jgi:hypothetical protein